eukprot:UN00290
MEVPIYPFDVAFTALKLPLSLWRIILTVPNLNQEYIAHGMSWMKTNFLQC